MGDSSFWLGERLILQIASAQPPPIQQVRLAHDWRMFRQGFYGELLKINHLGLMKKPHQLNSR
jgi:hypothetical protein